MKTETKWLNEMLDAALTDPPKNLREPDFQSVREASYGAGGYRSSHSRHYKRRLYITAAAAVLAASLAIPAGIITNRQIQTRRLIHEQNTIFVEELIGGTIFEDGLTGSPEDLWIFDTTVDADFFDV